MTTEAPAPAAPKPRARKPRDTAALAALAVLQARGGLSAWRLRMGLSYQQAADQLGLADRASVRRLCDVGARPPSPTLARLAVILEDGYKPARPKPHPDSEKRLAPL